MALPSPKPFTPEALGELIRTSCKNSTTPPRVTFLFGAGCSRSVDIPVASEIVRELRAKTSNPFLRDIGLPPEGRSEYAFLMEALTPKARADYVKGCVRKAEDSTTKRLRINWCHLLLAALVEHGCIHRILTTNFDPLIVEALAATGQPIRTYDLSLTGKYNADILDSGTVIYLHGQMHSLLLANTDDEMALLENLYPAVLQEAARDSFFIVVGYSGECDPVLNALARLPNLPQGLWWSHFNPSNAGPGPGVDQLVQKHRANFHLATGDDADTFMRKLVIDGMKLDLPKEILRPITATRSSLERFTNYPRDSQRPEADPLAAALELVKKAEEMVSGPPPASKKNRKKAQADPTTNLLPNLDLAIRLQMAALNEDWDTFNKLRKGIQPDPASPLSQVIGDGLLRRASRYVSSGRLTEAREDLQECAAFGVKRENQSWLPTILGNSLLAQARLKGNTPEADFLFAETDRKYAEALRLKPDMHEAFYNWGNALLAQAKLKGNAPATDSLLTDAGRKYAEALRLKPDMHEAFHNWGNALSAQAKLKGNTPEADSLFAEAGRKYAEALRLKPDDQDAFLNWGNTLSAQAKLKGNTLVADSLFTEAGRKYAEALRLEPDKHEAFYNWGNALFAQAQLKGNTPEADSLLTEAGHKYTEAIRLKPDKHQALFNLSCLSALKGNAEQTIARLQTWAKFAPDASRTKLDNDPDFDSVRDTPEFKAFRETLPA